MMFNNKILGLRSELLTVLPMKGHLSNALYANPKHPAFKKKCSYIVAMIK